MNNGAKIIIPGSRKIEIKTQNNPERKPKTFLPFAPCQKNQHVRATNTPVGISLRGTRPNVSAAGKLRTRSENN